MAKRNLLQAGAVRMHRPDVEGSAGVALQRNIATLHRPVRVRGLLQRRGQLPRNTTRVRNGVNDALQVGEEGLAVRRDRDLHVRALGNSDAAMHRDLGG